MDKYILGLFIVSVLITAIILCFKYRKKRGDEYEKPALGRFDSRGFDHNGIHRNGTKYDDAGYDCNGYNSDGFNRQGYNLYGKNQKGQYNRFYDLEGYKNGQYSADGFLNPNLYPVALSTHAQERIMERIEFLRGRSPVSIACEAYKFGKSARQIKKSSTILVREIEEKHNGGIVLIYHNYIYVFSKENVLITVYKNENIPL